MEENYSNVFSEIVDVIEHSEEKIKEKIPANLYLFFENNRNKDFKVNVNYYDEHWENSISQDAREILALIYRDYLVSDVERQQLLNEEKAEEEKIEKELREKYNIESVFNNKTVKVNNETKEEVQLVEYAEQKWFQKIFARILNLFNKL